MAILVVKVRETESAENPTASTLPSKLSIIERRDGNDGARTFVYHADLRFGNSDAHLHRIEIQHGEDRIAGGHRIAHVNFFHSDKPADGRPELAIAQVLFGFAQLGICRMRLTAGACFSSLRAPSRAMS